MNKLSLNNRYKNIAIILMIAIFFIFDRLLKAAALKNFSEENASQPLLGDLLSFSFAKNHAIAFSLPIGGPWLLAATGVIILIIAAIAAKKIWYLRRIDARAALLLLILTGAVSNFLDRWFFGYVIDYFSLKKLAIFNLADTIISLGAGALIWLIWRHQKKYHAAPPSAQSGKN